MKVKLIVEETLKYRHELTLDYSGDINEDRFEEILDEVTRECDDFSDIEFVLNKRYGMNIIESISSFPENPDDQECEIIDVEDVE